jgi:hypothetical protein
MAANHKELQSANVVLANLERKHLARIPSSLPGRIIKPNFGLSYP